MNTIRFVHIDLGEDGVFTDTHCVVTASVKPSVGHTLKVTRSRQCQIDQSIDELIHHFSPQSYFATDRHSLSQLEIGDRLSGRSEEHTSELQSRGHLVC